ncbi:MAG: ATP synthase F1 subunit epsilon [Bacteroidales bacterium]|jgi:F-type H+-transporting ATPase subunit epsilon|nr:ATP synthase F1 subunit epsilon [Bacteroidales bacterium]
MKLEIITPESKLFEGEVKLVQVPGKKGEFQILTHHAPIISTLEAGEIRVVSTAGEEKMYSVESGVVECTDDIIQILIEK